MKSITPILGALMVCLGGAARAQENVQDTLKRIGVQKGICVIVGTSKEADPIALAKESELIFFVQVADAGATKSLRQAVDQAGLLGTRVYVEQGMPDAIPLSDNLADAVIVAKNANKDEVLRVLRPGGKTWIVGGETTSKPFPEGADEWTHPYHGPDNNPQSRDTLAKGPFLTSFMAEPWYAAMHQVSVFGGGRIFKAFGNRTSTQAHWPMINTLIALNAWNGTTLWTRKLADGFMIHRNTMIATDDTLYLGDDTSCKLLDAATGVVRDEIKAPAELSDGPVWKWMALQDGVLYALVGVKEPKVGVVKGTRFRGAGWPWWKIEDYQFGFGRTLLAINPKTKEILWSYRDEQPLDTRTMAMAGGKIFIYCKGKFLGAVDQKTGKLLWKNSDKDMLDAVGAQRPAQRAYWGFASSTFMKATEKGLYFAGPTQLNISGVSAENGKLLWSHKEGNYQLVIRKDGLYAMGPNNLGSMKIDPISGEILQKLQGRVACTRATGSEEFIFVRGGRGGSTAVYDLRSATTSKGLISPMRPACQDGVVVANGRFYWGPWICRCDTTQIGVINLGPAGGLDYEAKADAGRLESADGSQVEGPAETAEDWPTYRKDNQRTGRTSVSVSEKATAAWTFRAPVKHVTTAPVVVAGTAYVSGYDGAVRAIDTATGKARWTAYTGGGVKFSPTYWKGRLLVGSGDGNVYCFDAASGRQIWKFRAAPAPRRIPVYGQLLSTWPVGSGVLVNDGIAYAAAGMTNYDGTHVYALDAATGKIKWQNNSSGHLYEVQEDSGAGVQGHFLLQDGSIYMPGGNLVPLAKFDAATGKFSRAGTPERRKIHGKDLFSYNGQIRTTGYPLYWRQKDQHFITSAWFPAGEQAFVVFGNRLGMAKAKPGEKGAPQFAWSKTLFTEYAGVAFAKNAIIVTGVVWDGEGPEATSTAGIVALAPDGKVLWKDSLPASPVMFGIAIDRDGRVLVSLQDGRVVAYK